MDFGRENWGLFTLRASGQAVFENPMWNIGTIAFEKTLFNLRHNDQLDSLARRCCCCCFSVFAFVFLTSMSFSFPGITNENGVQLQGDLLIASDAQSGPCSVSLEAGPLVCGPTRCDRAQTHCHVVSEHL